MFEECARKGSFSLSSGRKTDVFYDFDLLLPKEAAQYTEMLLQSVPTDVKRKISFVASPSIGGIVPGFLTAFALNKPFVIVDADGNLRGPAFDQGSYLLVDDVATSFNEANRVRKALSGKKCVGVACYIFRGSAVDLGKQDVPVFYLERKEEEV